MQKINKRTVTLGIIFLLILVVVALLIGNFTFSFLGADIGDDVVNQGETTASGDTIIFTSGNTLSLHATTDNFNATSGNLTDTTNPSARLIASSKTNEAASTYYAGVRINENTYTYSSGTTADVILTVKDESGENITTSNINGITWYGLTYSSFYNTTAYVMSYDNKVYLYEFEMGSDADQVTCQAYNEQIFNSISLK